MSSISRYAFPDLRQYSFVWAHEVGSPYMTFAKFQQLILKLQLYTQLLL